MIRDDADAGRVSARSAEGVRDVLVEADVQTYVGTQDMREARSRRGR